MLIIIFWTTFIESRAHLSLNVFFQIELPLAVSIQLNPFFGTSLLENVNIVRLKSVIHASTLSISSQKSLPLFEVVLSVYDCVNMFQPLSLLSFNGETLSSNFLTYFDNQ